MGLRETLNQNPAITTGGTVLVIVIAVGFIIYSQMGGGAPKAPTGAFFTIDDGKTYFADDVKKVAPFDKDGKQAVKAHVYKCKDGKEFVAYMERYTADAKKTMDEVMAKGKPGPEQAGKMAMMMQMGTEFKKPGDAKWIKMSDDYMSFGKMMAIKCSGGADDTPERVTP